MPKFSKKRSPTLNELRKRFEKIMTTNSHKRPKKTSKKIPKVSKEAKINKWKTNVLASYLRRGKYNSFSTYIIYNQDKLKACNVKEKKILKITKKSLKYNKHMDLVPHIDAFTEDLKKVCGEKALVCLAGKYTNTTNV